MTAVYLCVVCVIVSTEMCVNFCVGKSHDVADKIARLIDTLAYHYSICSTHY